MLDRLARSSSDGKIAIDNAIYVRVQPHLELGENIAVVMEHVKRPARSIHALMLNVNAILDGPGINAKIVRK